MVDWQASETPVGPESASPDIYANTPSPYWDRFKAEVGASSPIEKLGRLDNAAQAQLQGSLGAQLRAQRGDQGPPGVPDGAGLPDFAPPVSPILQPEDYNKKYAPEGQTLGSQPLPESVAQTLGRQRFADMQRDDIIRRNAQLHGWLPNLGTGMAAFMTDPTNVGATFLPGVGEESIMAALARGGVSGTPARIAARVGAGATAGALGMVPLTGAELLASHLSGADDYDLRSAFGDLAMGAATGALIHAGLFGTARELGILSPDEAMRYGRSARGAEAAGLPDNPIANADAMRAAVAQVSDGRPVDVQSILDIAAAKRAEGELSTWAAQAGRLSKEGDQALTQSITADGAVSPLEGAAQAAEANLERLRQEHSGWTSEIHATQARLDDLRSDTTPARLRAIEDELNDAQTSAARRASLEAERQMLTEGANPASALDAERTQAQLQGLQAGAARAQKQVAALESRVAAARAKVDQSAAAARASDSQLRVQSARIASRERIVAAMTARTIRRFAGHLGVTLQDGEAEAMAARIIRGEAKASDVLADLQGRKAEWQKGLHTFSGEPAIGDMVGRATKEFRGEAQRAMMDATQKEAQLARDGSAMGVSQADLAQAREDVYGEKPDVEPAAQPAGEGDPEMLAADAALKGMAESLTPEDHAAIAAADKEVTRASSLREAFAQAAQCLIGAGI